MNYLFFDLEYASSKGGVSKICEFGYVITNERFEVITRQNLIIDPNIGKSEWDWYVVKKILKRKISEYESNPNFTYFYSKIKELILSADYVIGHTLDSDAKALNDECERYGLESIDFDFYDVKEFYKEYSNSTKSTGLQDILKDLNIQGEEIAHDAETDAFNTMLELKNMLDKLNFTLEQLIELCPNAKDRTEDFKICSIEVDIQEKIEYFKATLSGDGTNDLGSSLINKKKYSQFLDNVKPQKSSGNKFKNKKLSISLNYEDDHYRQSLNLIQLITNEGGSVIGKASDADIFISYEVKDDSGNYKPDSKRTYVEEANRNGKKIQIISFKEFLDILGITEEQLDQMPMVSFEFLYDENTYIRDKKDRYIIDRIIGKKRQTRQITASGDIVVDGSIEKLSSSIGELFGDVLAKFQK